VLDGDLDRPMARGNFRKKDMPGHAQRHSAMSCAKMAEAVDLPFGLSTQVGQRMHILGGVHTGASWRIPLNRSCAEAMRHSCQITLMTCYPVPVHKATRRDRTRSNQAFAHLL